MFNDLIVSPICQNRPLSLQRVKLSSPTMNLVDYLNTIRTVNTLAVEEVANDEDMEVDTSDVARDGNEMIE